MAELAPWIKLNTQLSYTNSTYKSTIDNQGAARGGVVMAAFNTPSFLPVYADQLKIRDITQNDNTSLSLLKLRGGMGNRLFTISGIPPYSHLALLRPDRIGPGTPNYNPVQLENKDLTWETTTDANIGSVGNDIFNASRLDLELMNDFKNQSTAVLNRWTKPGQITNIPKAGDPSVLAISDRFIENGSYLRLKSATLGYDFKEILSMSNCPCCGMLRKEYYPAMANYLSAYVKEMAKKGFRISAVTIQNEPLYDEAAYPCMLMTAEMQRDFIKENLGPQFKAENIKTQIITYDHNWDHPEYGMAICQILLKQHNDVEGTAFHAYAGKSEKAMGEIIMLSG
ncbi:hypothetical protein FQR65_LT16309 [Abscondita terminalis]|nr:hypothetical protein FQR65_LT16309 [Abscondita terminalis]